MQPVHSHNLALAQDPGWKVTSANSQSTQVETDRSLLCHELAKLSSLFSAFRKCL